MLLESPAKPKKTALDNFKKDFDIDPTKYSLSGCAYNVCKYGFRFFHPLLLQTTLSLTLVLAPVNVGYFTQVSSESEYEQAEYGGTGGPEYEMFGHDWVHTDTNYLCDDGVWLLGSEGDRTFAYYATSTPLGEVMQFDFIPQGSTASNLAYARAGLYELVLGENSLEHISLKDLRTGEFVTLFKNDVEVGEHHGRIRIGKSLSTTTENTVTVEEKFLQGSSTRFRLWVMINDHSYVSAEMNVVNKEKFDKTYLGLVRSKEEEHPSVYFTSLRVCE